MTDLPSPERRAELIRWQNGDLSMPAPTPNEMRLFRFSFATAEPVTDAEVAEFVERLRAWAATPVLPLRSPARRRALLDAGALIERLARELAETRSHG